VKVGSKGGLDSGTAKAGLRNFRTGLLEVCVGERSRPQALDAGIFTARCYVQQPTHVIPERTDEGDKRRRLFQGRSTLKERAIPSCK
jgi:hypothetical protein